MRPSFSLGIEEEYQTIDPVTRDLRSHIETEMLEEGKLRLQERVKAEMHTSVVEVGTRICKNIDEAREDLILATIKKANWGETPTHLRVKFKNIRGVNYAYFTHEGWPDLPGSLGEAERRRFVSVWLNALSDFSVDGNHSRAAVATETSR